MESSVSRSCVTMNTVRPRLSLSVRTRLSNGACADRVEPRGRLVEEQDLRLERERARQGDTLPHAAGQLRRHLPSGVGRQADERQLETDQQRRSASSDSFGVLA